MAKKDNSNRGGLMNIYGWRPGEPPKVGFDKPFFEKSRMMIFNYHTTREAVEAVLPEPLEPGPQPFVACVIADYPIWNSPDGLQHGYNEVMMFVECQYKGKVGLAVPYMYVGARNGDFSECVDMAMAMGRESRGYPKKLANIYINRVGNEWIATVTRRGVRLITFRATFEEPIKPDDIPTSKYERLLLTKDIMSYDFQGYDLRELISQEADFLGHNGLGITLCLKGTGSVELGNIPNDPLDILKVVKPGIAVDFVQEGRSPVAAQPAEILATNW